MSIDNESKFEAPGWDAIDAALLPIYGEREPYHVGAIIPYGLGGPDPIQGISAYKNQMPVPHWHMVTYGFSDLWEKQSGDPDVSGFGFELTFRPTCGSSVEKPPNRAWDILRNLRSYLVKLRNPFGPGRRLPLNDPSAEKPPNWVLHFLQNLGRYVFESGNPFGPGHTLPLNGPIEQGSSTLIHAISFALDSQLPPIETPNGRVVFLQVVGLTMDELDAISSWNADAFFDLRRLHDPLLLTDLSRQSWLLDAEFAAEVDRRTRQEGSSCGWLNLVLECDTTSNPVSVRVQTIAVEGLRRRLLGRLPYGRELTLNGKDATVLFKPGERSGMTIVEGAIAISLRDVDWVKLTELLQPHVGIVRVPGIEGLSLEVVKTEITDRHGNIVNTVE